METQSNNDFISQINEKTVPVTNAELIEANLNEKPEDHGPSNWECKVQSLRWAEQRGFSPVSLIGKQPHGKEWQLVEKEKAINRALNLSRSKGNNIGVILGEISGIWVLDVDIKDNGVETINKLQDKHGKINTLTVNTGSGGKHFYFKLTEKYAKHHKVLKIIHEGVKVGIDFLTNGCQVVFPGSIHPDSGKYYVFDKDFDSPINEAEDWIYDLLLPSFKIEEAKIAEDNKKAKANDKIKTKKLKAANKIATDEDIQVQYYSGDNNMELTPEGFKITPIYYTEWEKPSEVNKPIPPNVLTELVEKLNISRAEQFNGWANVVWAIKSMSTSDEYYKIADLFSQRTTKGNYDKKALDTKWKQVPKKETQYNKYSLFKWLKEDIGEEEYNSFKSKHNIYNKSEKDKYFDAMLSTNEHKQFAEYYIFLEKKNIVAAGPDGPIYLYNSKTLLWQLKDKGSLGVHIGNKLYEVINNKFIPIDNKFKALKAKETKTADEEKDFLKHLTLIQIYKKLLKTISNHHTCITIASRVCSMIADPEAVADFDRKPGLLPIKGGKIVDLRTGTVRDRVQDDYFVHEIPTEYIPGKRDERFTNYIREIMLEDRTDILTMTNFLQTLLGYTISGDNSIHKLLIVFCGSGDNSKSTLINLLCKILGFFVRTAGSSVLLSKKDPRQADPELDELKTCRIAALAEFPDNQPIDHAIMKRITGGDEVRSRSLNKDGGPWMPLFCPIISANNPPLCTGDAQSLKRILMVSFLAHFTDNPDINDPTHRKINHKLYLKNDVDILQAGLAWLIEGAVNFHQNGLVIPKQVTDATNSYRSSMDIFDLFFDDEITIDPNGRELFADIEARFNQYCKKPCNKQFATLSGNKLGRRLIAKLGSDSRCGGTARSYRGIKLNTISSQSVEHDQNFNQKQLNSVYSQYTGNNKSIFEQNAGMSNAIQESVLQQTMNLTL